MKLHDFLSKVQ